MFLESFGRKEDSDAARYTAEVRRKVIELARSGTKVAQLELITADDVLLVWQNSMTENVARGND